MQGHSADNIAALDDLPQAANAVVAALTRTNSLRFIDYHLFALGTALY
ncbi:hypothetical protein ACPOL_3002 [Acidisarcina polymorpha]|uniref:Uncharacterized protein n=1 Tax=Acidisarcina polymorpha TaxID=2211140 RepID=A0A2Z5G0K6_9BACT|nr:hypothetical protein ACPOL_3002 [Acidisarcina polymorpha]